MLTNRKIESILKRIQKGYVFKQNTPFVVVVRDDGDYCGRGSFIKSTSFNGSTWSVELTDKEEEIAVFSDKVYQASLFYHYMPRMIDKMISIHGTARKPTVK